MVRIVGITCRYCGHHLTYEAEDVEVAADRFTKAEWYVITCPFCLVYLQLEQVPFYGSGKFPNAHKKPDPVEPPTPEEMAIPNTPSK